MKYEMTKAGDGKHQAHQRPESARSGDLKMLCQECGMQYVPDLPEDFAEHADYHDKIVNGYPSRPLESDKVVWVEGDSYITVVFPVYPLEQRILAAEVARIANRDTHYDFPAFTENEPFDERIAHVFLLRKKDRAIGLLAMEEARTIWRATWKSDGNWASERLTGHPAMWSITMIWIHRNHRRVGLGRTLVRAALRHHNITNNTVGWYTPFTESGQALVKELCPHEFYIAK